MFPNCLLVYICDILYQSTERSANAYSRVVYFKEYHGTCTKNVVLFVSIFNACVEQGWKHMTFFFWTHAQIIFQLWPISHSHFALSPKPDINPFIHTHTHLFFLLNCRVSPACVVCMRDISAHASKRLFNDWVFVCLLQLSNPSFTHSPHCTAHLHIHPSFSSYILLFKQLLILPRPVHPLTPLSLSSSHFPTVNSEQGGTAFIFHTIHTYSSSTQQEETPSKIQLQPQSIGMSIPIGGYNCCAYAFKFIYICVRYISAQAIIWGNQTEQAEDRLCLINSYN